MEGELLKLADLTFPVAIIEHCKTMHGPVFDGHLHGHHLQFFFFIKGDAVIYCNRKPCRVGPADLLLVNNGELHYGNNLSDELRFYIFRIDLDLLCSYGIPACCQKYIEPLKNNLVIFENRIKSEAVTAILTTMIAECGQMQEGYELKLVSGTFALLFELFRNHVVKSWSQRDAEILAKKTKRFQHIIDYIENSYDNPISLAKVSEMSHMSEGYFCRLFKQTTGRTLIDYINRIRIEKSVMLLNQGLCNVTEAALSVGFDDTNYFCRVFKKYMKQSPAAYRQNDRRYFL